VTGPPAAPASVAQRIDELLAGVNHQATSVSKYRRAEDYLESLLDLAPNEVYVAYISKAGNVSVRFHQSDRSMAGIVLVALVAPPAGEDPERTISAIIRYCVKKRPGAEVIALLRDGEHWIPYAAVVPDAPNLLIEATGDLWRHIRVERYALPKGQPISSQRPVSRLSEPRGRVTFYVNEQKEDAPPDGRSYPCVVLNRGLWDDFGFKTSFDMTLYLAETLAVKLGEVKIMMKGQDAGKTKFSEKVFRSLGVNYCSLGQSYRYYETLNALPQSISRAVMRGLRDAVFNSRIHAAFEEEAAFKASLLRTGTAARALADARSLFFQSNSQSRPTKLSFTFGTTVGGDRFDIDFIFADSGYLPDRVNAVIGYNGTGKTQLLAKIARVASSDLRRREELIEKVGEIKSQKELRFGKVIAISYSAFDTFSMPDAFWRKEEAKLAHLKLEQSGEVGGYAYCGLRKRAVNQDQDAVEPRELKSIDEIEIDFRQALELASSGERRELLMDTLSIVSAEPSIGRLGLAPKEQEYRKEWYENFNGLSTGHKIVINILAQAIGRIEPRSIVLIDEPESHLHPSLLAAMLRALNLILSRYESYAIIATHSPVVLQEIPRRYVRVLQRYGQKTTVTQPLSETFGENVGYLTSNVFDLDSTKTDYHSVLEGLAAEMSMEEIDELFEDDMSAQARAYLYSIKSGRRK
jgi:hypothetical protein